MPVAAALSLSAACGSGAPTGAAPGSQSGGSVIRVDGSSTVFPITEAVAEDFQRSTPGTKVTVGISGTGGGFEKFCRAEIDVSDASRPISETELAQCGQANVEFIELPIGYDGLTVVVNPKNTWAHHITVAELKTLWEPAAQGRVMKWSQVRAEWPDREIHLFGAGVDSGTFDYFTEAIVGKAKSSRGDYTSSEDDNVLVQGISGDELALGYFGLAYYEENQAKLRALPVDAGDGRGPIAPSKDTVRTNDYRPLSRPLFVYVARSAFDRPEVKAFVDYYLTNATRLVSEVGYVPLTGAEYALVTTRAQQKHLGTMFADHRPKPGTSLESLLGALSQ